VFPSGCCSSPTSKAVEALHSIVSSLINVAGSDLADATCSQKPVEDYTTGLLPLDSLSSKPLAFKRLALIQEACGEGVDAGKSGLRHIVAAGADYAQD
jgi:aspartyl-tRNA(Asn)/glutamyl-tRNA(Gln) amidotransferase subunit A